MRISGALSRLFERWHRPEPNDIELWLKVWREAYDIAYFTLLDSNLAKEVARRTVLSLSDGYKRRRHRRSNQNSYHRKVEGKGGQAKLHRLQLPDDLELARWVFFHSTEKELEKERRGDATLDDFDVWFIKSVVQHCLTRSNAFSMAVGMSAGIHAYTPKETTHIWYELVEAVPRREEAWGAGNEPFVTYWSKLRGDIKGRFGSIIRTDNRGNFVRREKSRQPKELVALCVAKFTRQGSNDYCLANGTGSPGVAGADDSAAESRRCHIILHPPCYEGLVERAGLPPPHERIGLPEYITAMSSNRNDINRTPPPLTGEELDEAREELQRSFNLRRTAPASVVIQVDGVEQNLPGRGLAAAGSVHLRARDDAQAIEVLARQAEGPDVPLTGCLLSHAGGERLVLLEGGQELYFSFQYVDDEIGEAFYDISIRYRETDPVRAASLAWKRLTGRAGTDRRPDGRRARPLVPVLLTSLLVVLAAGAAYRFWPTADRRVEDSARQHEGQATSQDSLGSGAPASGPGDLAGASPTPQPPPAIKARESAGRRTGAAAGSVRDTTSQSRRGRTESAGNTKARKTGSDLQEESLATAKQIYVAGVDLDADETLRSLNLYIPSAMERSGVLRVAESKGESQVVLRVIYGYRGAGEETIRPRLETKSGRPLWEGPHIPLPKESTPDEMRAAAGELVDSVVGVLMHEREQGSGQSLRR